MTTTPPMPDELSSNENAEFGSSEDATDEDVDRELLTAAVEIDQTVAGAQLLGIEDLTFDQLMTYISAQREYQAKAYADTAAVDNSRLESENQAKSRENELQAEERADKRKISEARFRAVLALVLVAATVTGVLYGLFQQTGADQVSQYMAPISGLAGIVVGYFFGREAK